MDENEHAEQLLDAYRRGFKDGVDFAGGDPSGPFPWTEEEDTLGDQDRCRRHCLPNPCERCGGC